MGSNTAWSEAIEVPKSLPRHAGECYKYWQTSEDDPAMKLVPNRYLIALLVLYLAGATTSFAADKTATAPSWKTDLLAWRAQQAKNLQTPNGWLTVIGLEWLKPGDNSVGSAKGNALVIKAPTAPITRGHQA